MVTVSTVMSHEKEEEEERRVPPTNMAGMEWELETEEEEEKATSCWQQRWRRTTTTVEKSEGEEEVEDGDFEFRRRSQWERLQSRQEQGQSQAASATVSTSSSRPRPCSYSSPPPAHPPRPSRPRRLSVSKGVEGCEASAAQWAALRALLVLSVALLPSATVHSFVAFDRTSSCVRAFGCSEELVGFLLEIPSAETCLQMCDANPACNFFTWRAGQADAHGMFHNFCFLHSRCESLDFTCRDCYSGPRSEYCPFSRRNM